MPLLCPENEKTIWIPNMITSSFFSIAQAREKGLALSSGVRPLIILFAFSDHPPTDTDCEQFLAPHHGRNIATMASTRYIPFNTWTRKIKKQCKCKMLPNTYNCKLYLLDEFTPFSFGECWTVQQINKAPTEFPTTKSFFTVCVCKQSIQLFCRILP